MARSGRIALAQIDTTIGDFEGNAARVRAATGRARNEGATLVVFPELTLCGYPPRDFLDEPLFLARAERTLSDLAQPADWSRDIALAVGFPELVRDAPPPGVYNAVALIAGGRVAAVGRKSLLPTYDVFDETRYFLPAPSSTAVDDPSSVGMKLGLSICEDVWNDKRFWDRPRYARDPIGELVKGGARLIVNLSASPYAMGKPALREKMLGAAARDHGIPIAYVNQVGGNDALLFDGGSLFLSGEGKVMARAPLFEEALVVVDLETGNFEVARLSEEQRLLPARSLLDPTADEVFRALVMGLRDYVTKCGFSSAVVGLSGGIDSALTACIAVEALGPHNVLGVSMPSRYSSDHSREDAVALADALGIRLLKVPIERIHTAFEEELKSSRGVALCDVADQNVQARIRGQILMALSNDTGGIVLSTGNKSELAVGYCTLYGDMAGGLAVIGDLPKTLVYRVARCANDRAQRTLIPERTFTKPPSAELRPDQVDADSLPPYDMLDDILEAYVGRRESVDTIVERGHDEKLVRRVLNMVVASEYKRRQAAPVLKVSDKAFGEGRRLPIAHRYRQ